MQSRAHEAAARLGPGARVVSRSAARSPPPSQEGETSRQVSTSSSATISIDSSTGASQTHGRPASPRLVEAVVPGRDSAIESVPPAASRTSSPLPHDSSPPIPFVGGSPLDSVCANRTLGSVGETDHRSVSTAAPFTDSFRGAPALPIPPDRIHNSAGNHRGLWPPHSFPEGSGTRTLYGPHAAYSGAGSSSEWSTAGGACCPSVGSPSPGSGRVQPAAHPPSPRGWRPRFRSLRLPVADGLGLLAVGPRTRPALSGRSLRASEPCCLPQWLAARACECELRYAAFPRGV